MTGPYLPLPHFSTLTLTGKDRLNWLHNLCTQNIKSLAAGSVVESFFTNVKGKVIGHGWIAIFPEEVRIIGDPDQAKRLAPHFDRYLFREEVVILDPSPNWSFVGYPHSSLPERSDWTMIGDPVSSHLAISHTPEGSWAWQGNWLGPTSWMLAIPADLSAAWSERHVMESDLNAWHRHRLRHGIPFMHCDIDEQSLPQELDRDPWAISFQKGCYLGQETIARLDALGQVQKKLVCWQCVDSPSDLAEPLSAGTSLYLGDQVAGQITSVVESIGDAGYLGLAIIKRMAFQAATLSTASGRIVQLSSIPQPASSSDQGSQLAR